MRIKKLPEKLYDVIKIAGSGSILNQSKYTDPKQGLAIALFHFEKRSNTTLATFPWNPNSSFCDLHPNYDVDPKP
jgi:hypothetical protein